MRSTSAEERDPLCGARHPGETQVITSEIVCETEIVDVRQEILGGANATG